METTIEELAGAAGHYSGSGDGVESGPFTATVDVRSLLDGLAVEIVYEAIGQDGERLHVEHTLLTYDMITGEPTLYVTSAELRGMAQLRQLGTNRFGNSKGLDGFDLRIELELEGDELTYVWSWGPPHEETTERSRAVVRRAG